MTNQPAIPGLKSAIVLSTPKAPAPASGSTDSGVKVYGNFIHGGQPYNLRNETSVGLDVRNNTFGNSN